MWTEEIVTYCIVLYCIVCPNICYRWRKHTKSISQQSCCLQYC